MKRLLIFCISLALSINLFSQQVEGEKIPTHYYNGNHKFLSSALLEGREPGTRGNSIAAEFIASQMESYGLLPLNREKDSSSLNPYYQYFGLQKYRTQSSVLKVSNEFIEEMPAVVLRDTLDYHLIPGSSGCEADASVVFAGFGIKAPGKTYDDYAGLEVKGQVVMLIEGLPGGPDTPQQSYKTFMSLIPESWGETEYKAEVARKLGAKAVIVIKNSSLKVSKKKEKLATISAEDSIRALPYTDDYYRLPDDTASMSIPVFSLTEEAATKIFAVTGYRLDVYLKFRTLQPETSLPQKPGLKIRVETVNHEEYLTAKNILALIPGKDQNRSVIVGAHYDHLGKRGEAVYAGADDNASGVAAMLAIARYWSQKKEAPPCNLVFASWSAEEKGLLGSRYFNLNSRDEGTLLYINMDMVSRSDASDSLRKILSIGTLKETDSLRSLATRINELQPRTFQLDLWEVNGHTGSDYASFIEYKIPVMTFFSGFHDDYHSPLDTYKRVDSAKMGRVIRLVNDILEEYLEKEVKKDSE
jgi:hypothetical protein